MATRPRKKKRAPSTRPKAPERHHTTMRIRADLLARLDADARARSLSRNALVEQLIAKHLLDKGYTVKDLKGEV